MNYRLVRSRRRSLEMRVTEDGEVLVRAPEDLPRAEIDRFVRRRGSWIERQRQRQAERPRPRWRDGDQCRDLGDLLTLRVRPGLRARVERDDQTVRITVPDPADEQQVREAVRRWWRSRARGVYQASIERQFGWFAARGHRQPVLRLKWMRTRWGSLSQRGYINLNLALMEYPIGIIDYVVMHELCHLEHMNHGPQFHDLMGRRMPDWPARKRVLDAGQPVDSRK